MAELCKHRRIPYPMLSAGKHRLDCTCGWQGRIAPGLVGDPAAALERKFIEHVPPDQRRAYVLVDQRPHNLGNWLMPEAVEVEFLGWYQAEPYDMAQIRVDGAEIEMPIGEIRLEDGRVFRPE